MVSGGAINLVGIKSLHLILRTRAGGAYSLAITAAYSAQTVDLPHNMPHYKLGRFGIPRE
jgi:hypothetical protein